jgi:dihydrofolate reductase
MKRLIISLHISLDGFVAGPEGQMDWIRLDKELFDLVGTFTAKADTALYGRVTWEMMDAYWPTAADKPDPTTHDLEHSAWYKSVEKVVLSRTMQGRRKQKTTFIGAHLAEEVAQIKSREGGDILVFGSPTAIHALMELGAVDEFWLFINPVILGRGIPLFTGIGAPLKLKLLESKLFPSGVIGVHYAAAQ